METRDLVAVANCIVKQEAEGQAIYHHGQTVFSSINDSGNGNRNRNRMVWDSVQQKAVKPQDLTQR